MAVKTKDNKILYGCYLDFKDGKAVLRKITTDRKEAAAWVDNTDNLKVIDEVPDKVAEKHGYKISS